MTHTFDERGERAIARLRADKRFNEALYRELGPVKYWTKVREAEERIRLLKRASGGSVLETPQGHNHYTQELRKREDEVSKFDNGLPLEKATKDHSKAVNIATSIMLIGGALAVVGIALTIVAICCYGAWTLIF